MEGKEKKQSILIILVVLLISVASFTFAYLFIDSNNEALLDIELETKDDKTLIFYKGNDLGLSVVASDFNIGDGNVAGDTSPYVTLIASDEVTEVYSVFLNIYENAIIYSTESESPELLLNIYDEEGAEIKFVDGLNYITEGDVSGFDITDVSGSFKIFIDKEISANSSETTHNWKFEVTYLNSEELQNLNLGSTFSAGICLAQSEDSCEYSDSDSLSVKLILDGSGGKKYIEGKGTPDFSTIADTDEGMFATEDDYGTSYYYRGAVDNNWVKFGGFYWRIIRIDGNGGIKLIYSGSEATGPVTTGTDTQISKSQFNSSSIYLNDGVLLYYSPEGVGYVYEDSKLHGLVTNSTAKTALDTWYNTNLASYESYLDSSKFCIDRTGYTDGSDTTVLKTEQFTGNETYISYGGRYRLEFNKTPSIKCNDNIDILSLKIGLISGDEVSLAGGVYGVANSEFYLYTAATYWTLTPAYFSSTARIIFVSGPGDISTINNVGNNYGLRPSVTLKSDTIISKGDGSMENPYEVVD